MTLGGVRARLANITTRAMRPWLPTEVILSRWRPGSGDWDWPSEWADIVQQDGGTTIAGLIGDIAAHGVREQLLLGDDGRVWDGHHRLFVARLLGIETLPVEYGHSTDDLRNQVVTP